METLSAAIAHETVSANGVRFHVATAGRADAPLLLCLHGFPECWYSWRHVLERLSSRFRVVAPDLRGYGESEKPRSGYDLPTLAEDARSIARALGRERFHLAGHDWGGAVAYATAAQFPAQVERLVVMNCPHPAAMRRALFTNPRQIARFWYFFMFQIPKLPELYLARNDGRAIAGSFKSYAGRRDKITREDRDVFRRAMLQPGALEGALAYYREAFRSMFKLDAIRGVFPKISSPSLILWGERDPALGVELTYGLEEYFSGELTIRYFPDVGHWTQQEAPDEVCAAIDGFIPSGSQRQ